MSASLPRSAANELLRTAKAALGRTGTAEDAEVSAEDAEEAVAVGE